MGILDARVMKGQNACLLCWKTWHYTTIFYFSLIFPLNLNEFNFDIIIQSLFRADEFGGGVIMWLINNVHVVVEGLKTWIWPLLFLKLFISFVFILKLGSPVLCWLFGCSYVLRFFKYINELLWRSFLKFIFRLIQIVKYEKKNQC